MVLFKLVPRTAFHFGQRGVGVEGTEVFFRADSLFSALCLTLRALEADGHASLTRLLERFPGVGGSVTSPPFRLTSAFPFAGEVLFLPKPMVPANLGQASDAAEEAEGEDHSKTLKKVAFVSMGIFAGWLNNLDLSAHLADENLLHGGELWVTAAERQALAAFGGGEGGAIRLWIDEEVPRVTVDRVTSKSAVFQAGRVRYRRVSTTQGEQRSGLWVLVDWPAGQPAQEEVDRLAKLFAVLGDSGLGGERSAGYGQFDLEGPVDFAGFAIQGLGQRWLTLAPYHPQPAELGPGGTLGPHCAYRLLVRRGWVGSPEGMSYRRPFVRLLAEGAVLHHPSPGTKDSYGDLVDVTPTVMDPAKGGDGHKVWRYGIAFPVPVGIPAQADALEVGP